MIVFCHGDKGGVAKSVTASLVTDAAVAAGRSPIVIEGDKNVPDVGRRFESVARVAAVSLNLAGNAETAALEFGDAIEKFASREDAIVVNLPAGASDTLDDLAAVIVEGVAKPLGHEVVVSYNVAPSGLAAAGLAASLSRGLVGAADRAVVIYPLFLAPSPAGFAWHQSPERAAFLRKFGDTEMTELVMPTIRPDQLRQKALDLPAPFSHLATRPDAGLTLGERALFARWLSESLPIAKAILGPWLDATPAAKRRKADA